MELPIVNSYSKTPKAWDAEVSLRYQGETWVCKFDLPANGNGTCKWVCDGEEVDTPDWINMDDFWNYALQLLFFTE